LAEDAILALWATYDRSESAFWNLKGHLPGDAALTGMKPPSLFDAMNPLLRSRSFCSRTRVSDRERWELPTVGSV